MTNAVNNTLQQLVPIFQDVLDDDSLAIDATTTAQDVEAVTILLPVAVEHVVMTVAIQFNKAVQEWVKA